MNITRHFDIKVGQALQIGGAVTVTLQKKSGQLARLTVDRPENMRVEVKSDGVASLVSKGLTQKVAA